MCCLRAVILFFLAVQILVAKEESSPPPVLEPAKQLATFRFAESGYRIELVASEPMVRDPVAIAFDGEGRLWVVEMCGFMQDIDGSRSRDPIGRVSVLEDFNGDGRMDHSQVFADHLVLPRAISLHHDGVLIAENKALWFFQEGRKNLVDPNYACDSIEHSANGLLRAMDNWIYNAKEGHRYRRTASGWEKNKTEPRGQWGICQDNRGRLYYNYNHSELYADFVPPNFLTRNPNHEPTTGLGVGIASNNVVFPIRPTPAANRAYIPGSLDEQGRISQFTSACAPLIYRGALFPELVGHSLVCEPVGNLIKRSQLNESGIFVSAVPTYPDRDFLASTDERFRPCWLAEGPDGAIYIADMYRGVVQDAPHMSPYLREHSIAREMTTPIHLGRIWRIVPEKTPTPGPKPAFAKMGPTELVATLAHPAGWWRDQAQKFLVEKNLRAAIPSLRTMALQHASAEARLHALWTLEGLRDPEPEKMIAALRDHNPTVCAAALRVLVSLGLPHDRMVQLMTELSAPPDELALQMILTAGDLEIDNQEMFSLIINLSESHLINPLFRDAVLSSLTRREVAILQTLVMRWGTNAEAPGPSFLIEALSQAVVKSRDARAVGELLTLLSSFPPEEWKAKAIWSGISVHASSLSRKTIKLEEKPNGWETFPDFSRLFSWPGHTPEPIVGSARPLNAEEAKLITRGRQVYLSFCVGCHGNEGEGAKNLAPPLAGSDWVTGSEARLARILFHGLSGPITVSGKLYQFPDIQPLMPPLAMLKNSDIAAVLSYIRREWGNDADPVLEKNINRHRINAQGRTVPWTETELEVFK